MGEHHAPAEEPTHQQGQAIELRQPVINEHNAAEFDMERRKKEMGLITVLVTQEMTRDQALRDTVASFTTVPLSEELPLAFMERLEHVDNQRLKDLLGRYQESLKAFLRLPAVPDELLQPDITNATSFRPNGRSTFHPEGSDGVSNEERGMVGERYVFARYVKRLALGAELLAHPDLHPSANGTIDTPSGVHVQIDGAKAADVAIIVNPLNWETNHQLKDRVYEITTGGKHYILKERKTARHMHTKRRGHVDGLTSAEEFATGKRLQEMEPVEEGEIKLHWEKPIGYVEYPDGYSFTIFEHENNFTPIEQGRFGPTSKRETDIISAMAKLIEERAELYSSEFSELVTAVDTTIKSPNFFGTKIQLPNGRENKMTPLTFEHFARVKALVDVQRSQFLYHKTLLQQNISNADLDGLGFRTTQGAPHKKPTMELLAFDLEYYKPLKREQHLKNMTLNEAKNNLEIIDIFSGHGTEENPATSSEALLYLFLNLKLYPELLEVLKDQPKDFTIDLRDFGE